MLAHIHAIVAHFAHILEPLRAIFQPEKHG